MGGFVEDAKSTSISLDDRLWDKYNLYIDLYKFYFSVTLKINAFFLAVSGAISTYYFSNLNVDQIQYSLMFPILIGFFMVVLFVFGLFTIGALEQDMRAIAEKLQMNVRVTISALYYLWVGSIAMIIVACIALGYLTCSHS